jgi:hypothetical protein
MNRQRPGERLSMQRVEDSRHTLTPDHKIAPTLGLLLIGVTCWQDAQGQPATTRVSPTHHQRLRRTHTSSPPRGSSVGCGALSAAADRLTSTDEPVTTTTIGLRAAAATAATCFHDKNRRWNQQNRRGISVTASALIMK